MTDLNTVVAEIELGDEAEKFKKSSLYKFIKGCADQEVSAAQADFESCDPENTTKIKNIHKRINYARGALKWIDDIIYIARSNEEMLENADD